MRKHFVITIMLVLANFPFFISAQTLQLNAVNIKVDTIQTFNFDNSQVDYLQINELKKVNLTNSEGQSFLLLSESSEPGSKINQIYSVKQHRNMIGLYYGGSYQFMGFTTYVLLEFDGSRYNIINSGIHSSDIMSRHTDPIEFTLIDYNKVYAQCRNNKEKNSLHIYSTDGSTQVLRSTRIVK